MSAPLASEGFAVLDFAGNRFRQDDSIEYILAWLSLLPHAALVAQAAVVYSRREVHQALLFLGTLLNALLTKVLKSLVSDPRPAERCVQLDTCGEHGLPSSHTSLSFYLVAIILLSILRTKEYSPDPKASSIDHLGLARAWQALEALAALATASAVGVSRVQLGYHTWAQVIAGAGQGVVFGTVWHAATVRIVAPALRPLLGLRLVRALGVRDSLCLTWPTEAERALCEQGSEPDTKKRR
ncbi:unnamed protein product [Pedinophyceae sp. YPF-701]|nr:unnamed protein product [Pedinophyceae sp. YPF-701]